MITTRNTRKPRRTIATLLCLPLIGLSAAGCSLLGSETAKKDNAALSVGPKNVGTWQLPLDQFSLTLSASRDDSWAAGALHAKCMDEAGFPQTEIPRLAESVSSYNAVGLKLFTPELAAEWGYGEAHDPDFYANYAANIAQNSRELGPDEQKADKDCTASVRKRLPDISSSTNVITSLAVKAYETASKKSNVLAASKLWRECLAPAGISDLPKSPHQMPTRSMIAELGMTPDDDSTREPIITTTERKFAVKDAECRASSGFVEAAYEAEWDAQAALLASHSEAISRAAKRIAEHNALVQRILNAS